MKTARGTNWGANGFRDFESKEIRYWIEADAKLDWDSPRGSRDLLRCLLVVSMKDAVHRCSAVRVTRGVIM